MKLKQVNFKETERGTFQKPKEVNFKRIERKETFATQCPIYL